MKEVYLDELSHLTEAEFRDILKRIHGAILPKEGQVQTEKPCDKGDD